MIICVANQKGGVGKTTTSINLASALCRLGKRVLIIDMDPQANTSSGLGVKARNHEKNDLYHVLIGSVSAKKALQATTHKGLFVLASSPDLVGAEIELVNAEQREYRLKHELQGIQNKFDFILIDCPPSLGLLTLNALTAADYFLVPLQCEYYALEGLSQLLYTAGLVKKHFNPHLDMMGIILTMFDQRNNLSHQVVADIEKHFATQVFKSIIPRSVRLSEAPSHGKSIFEYDDKSVGAQRYLSLAKEVLQRSSQPDIQTAGEIRA